MFVQIIASMVSSPLRPAQLKELNPGLLLEVVNGFQFCVHLSIFLSGLL